MPNLSRYRLILPAWFLLLLVAVSCSSPAADTAPTAESGASNESGDSSDSAETDDTAEPVEISFMVFGDPAELAAYQALAAAFTARQDEVDVELVHIPSQTD